MEILITIDQYKTQVQNILKKDLNSWLTDDDSGLQLSKIIDDVLDVSKTKISDKVIQNNIEGVDYLLKYDKISKSDYDRFISEIKSRKLIHDKDGNWLPINKLNTNYADISKLLTDLLFNSYLNKKDTSSKKILLKLVYFKNIEEVKDILLKNKRYLVKLFNKYKEIPNIVEKWKKYTTNIVKLSDIGEETENKVKSRLESARWVKLYQGGNGDYIDMLFSVDLIMEHEGWGWTFQVKSSKNGADEFIKKLEKNKNKYRAVDYLIYPVKNNYVIYNLKTKEVIEIPS
jgi:hypothetical protein